MPCRSLWVQARSPQGVKMLGFGLMWRVTHYGRKSRNRGYPALSAARELQDEGQEAQTARFTQTAMKEDNETLEPHKPQWSAERAGGPAAAWQCLPTFFGAWEVNGPEAACDLWGKNSISFPLD